MSKPTTQDTGLQSTSIQNTRIQNVKKAAINNAAKLFTLITLGLLIQACTSQSIKRMGLEAKSMGLETSESGIIKSPNDSRSYKAVTLDNALQVMLISDPTADKAAASMDVYVGSANDPEELPGLAHFLEHMLFLGTEKYPDADAYQKFISEHGGRHNAFTSAEHTNYFFEVSSEALPGALDRFAQQFTAPLFNEEYVVREVNAVHSEYSSKLKDDGRRYFSALKQTLAAEHPYGKFSVGNLATLKDREDLSLRDALLKFYAEHYSANTMRLVILGKESLAELENLARTKFSAIKNRNLKHKAINQAFFEPDFLPAQLSIIPVKDTRSMVVAFPIPSAMDLDQSQPTNFLANLIGHEGEGSLLSALKEQELVDSLSAGTQFDTRHQAIFMLNMSLTEKGLANSDKILDVLFSYIDLVKREGMRKMYFDEQASMLDISFRFQEKMSPFTYVRALAGALQDTPANKVLVEGYELTDFNPELYQEFASYLRPGNMLITLSAQSLETESNQHDWQKTPWFKTPYRIQAINGELIERWSNPQAMSALTLPKANQFIPSEVSLLTAENDAKPKRLGNASDVEDTDLESTDLESTDLENSALKNIQGLEVWHAVDTSFGTPKSNLFVTLRSPAAMESAETLNQIEMMVSLFKDALNEFSYPAYLAGLNYELYNHMRGVTIKISGYSDKQALLLSEILSTIKHQAFDNSRYQIIKERLGRKLANLKARKPYEQALGKLQQELLSPSWSPEQRIAALPNTSLEDMEAFRKAFFSTLDIALLVNGNTDTEQARDIADMLQVKLLDDAEKTPVKRAQVRRLSEQALGNALAVPHPDTGFVLYAQGNSRDYKERAQFSVLSQLIASDYYNDLRTEQQLGYIVFASHFPMLDVPGIGFIVQSPVADGPALLKATQAFLKAASVRLITLKDDELERAKASVISKLSKQDNTLYEKSNRYWQEIDRENQDFNTRENLTTAVKSLTLAELTETLEGIISGETGQMLIYTVKEDGKPLEANTLSGDRYTKLEEAEARYFK